MRPFSSGEGKVKGGRREDADDVDEEDGAARGVVST